MHEDSLSQITLCGLPRHHGTSRRSPEFHSPDLLLRYRFAPLCSTDRGAGPSIQIRPHTSDPCLLWIKHAGHSINTWHDADAYVMPNEYRWETDIANFWRMTWRRGRYTKVDTIITLLAGKTSNSVMTLLVRANATLMITVNFPASFITDKDVLELLIRHKTKGFCWQLCKFSRQANKNCCLRIPSNNCTTCWVFSLLTVMVCKCRKLEIYHWTIRN